MWSNERLPLKSYRTPIFRNRKKSVRKREKTRVISTSNEHISKVAMAHLRPTAAQMAGPHVQSSTYSICFKCHFGVELQRMLHHLASNVVIFSLEQTRVTRLRLVVWILFQAILIQSSALFNLVCTLQRLLQYERPIPSFGAFPSVSYNKRLARKTWNSKQPSKGFLPELIPISGWDFHLVNVVLQQKKVICTIICNLFSHLLYCKAMHRTTDQPDLNLADEKHRTPR